MKIYLIACYNYDDHSRDQYYNKPVKEDMVAIDVVIPDQIRSNEKKLIGHDLKGNPLYKGGDEGYYYEDILRKAVYYGWVADSMESFRDLVKKYQLNCSQTYYLAGESNDLVFKAKGRV